MAKGIENKKKSDNFASGVLILSLSAIIVKIIGLIYKIPMLGLLGSEGMGYFNSAYEIYALFCSVATTGLPVAMSVMISSGKDREDKAKVVFGSAIKLFLLIGAIGCIIIILFSKVFAGFLGSVNAAPCLFAIAPCVCLICVSGAYRGYFQGLGKMTPTAISQMIESIGKLILGLLFAFVALRSGFQTPYVAAFAVVGLTLGTAVSMLYLILTKRFSVMPSVGHSTEKGILHKLLSIAVPITLSSSVVSITKVIDMSMLLRRLGDIGQSGSEAFAAYGNYTTLALPLFSLAPALITSVAMPLIPSLSSAVAKRDCEEQVAVVGDAIRLTTFISAPISLGVTFFSRPILELIFSGETAAIEFAYPLLAVLGLSVVSSCFITVGNAVLQAYGRPAIPILSMSLGAMVKIIASYILIGRPEIGIIGAPIGTFVCDITVNAVNFYFICKSMPGIPSFGKGLLRPFFAAAVSVSLARLLYNGLSIQFYNTTFVTWVSIAAAALLYLLTTFIFGVFGREELSKIPFVGSILNRNQKIDI